MTPAGTPSRRKRRRAALTLSGALLLALPLAGLAVVRNAEGGDDSLAFSLPDPALTGDPAAMARFAQGASIFRSPWKPPPAEDDADFTGLGPVYNDISCLACHMRNGRGRAPDGERDSGRGLLLRLSLPSADAVEAAAGPAPLPAYGDQLQDHALPGVPPEGRLSIRYTEDSVPVAGGTPISLRTPHISVIDPAFGPLPPETLLSARIAQPVFGTGGLQAIPEADILAEAARQQAAANQDHSPVHGHPNRVLDVAHGGLALGRFGWKANQPSLEQQTAAAAHADMGLTSPLFPRKSCPAAQTACRAQAEDPRNAGDGAFSLGAERLALLTAYMDSLAVPPRRHAEDAAVRQGEALFAASGCAACHRPRWDIPAPDGPGGQHRPARTIRPYTDMLLHDMGPGLADGRPDFLAGGRDWRTAPLWGAGLTQRVRPDTGFLHDGRARSLTEAILWHGGEAQPARDAFAALPPASRDALLAFLGSL